MAVERGEGGGFSPRSNRWAFWEYGLLAATLLICLLGCVLVIHAYASPLPLSDQWHGESYPIERFRSGSLQPSDLYAPHVDHRLLWTRLLSLGQYAATGTWDVQRQAYVNLVILGSMMLWLVILMRKALGPIGTGLGCALMLYCYAVPLSVDNLLMSFNNQYYFHILFSSVLLYLLCAPSLTAKKVIAIALLNGANALNMLSSVLVPVVAIPLTVAMATAGTIERRTLGWRLALCGALILCHLPIMHISRTGEITGVENIFDFYIALRYMIAWPAYANSWYILANIGLCLAGLLWISKKKGDPSVAALTGLGIWSFLQLVLLAFNRGNGGGYMATRYLEVNFAYFMACAGLLVFFVIRSFKTRYAVGGCLLAVLYAGWTLNAHGSSVQLAARESRSWLKTTQKFKSAIETYQATGSSEELDKHPWAQNVQGEIKAILNDPERRSIIPALRDLKVGDRDAPPSHDAPRAAVLGERLGHGEPESGQEAF